MSDMSITVGRVTYLCCQFCSYKTRFTGNLAKHVRTHTGERPFECYFCGKRFASKSNYNTHIVTHTGPNGTLACPVFGCPFQTDKGSRMHWHFKQVHIDQCTETNLADVVRNVPMVTSLLPNNRSSPRLSPRAAGRQLSPIGSFLMPNISAAGFSNSTLYSNSSMYGITRTSETQNGCASKSGDSSHPELTPSGSHSSNRERIYDFAFPITNYAAIENGTEEEVEDVKPNIYTLLNYLHANSNKALLNSQRNIKIEEVEEKRPSEKNENESSSRSATTPSRPPIIERDQDRRTSEGLNHDKEPAEENKQNGESGSTSDDSKRAELFPANFIDNLTDVHTQMLIDSLVKESRLYRCDLCNILFPEYSVFVLHVGCHGNDSAFQCHFCRETFSDKFGFLSHFIRCPHELKNC